ncbi:MAG: Na(+)/H(+) antiporter subunit D, partial [Mariniblastus sp.]
TVVVTVDRGIRTAFLATLNSLLRWFSRLFSEKGALGSTWSTSQMAFCFLLLLGVCLVLYYL